MGYLNGLVGFMNCKINQIIELRGKTVNESSSCFPYEHFPCSKRQMVKKTESRTFNLQRPKHAVFDIFLCTHQGIWGNGEFTVFNASNELFVVLRM